MVERQPRVAIVTGAGTGLGRAIALELYSRGWSITLVGRREKPLGDTAKACGNPRRICCCPADLRPRVSPGRVVALTMERFGRLDALVNNAGLARFSSIDSSSDDDVEDMLSVNFLAPYRMARAAVPFLRQSRGSVLNVSSIGGVLSLPGRAAYGASKAALNHLTRSLARELSPDVRVNGLVPGAIDSEMWMDLGLNAAQTKRLKEEMGATTPLQRMGQPEELAHWAAECLSGRASWMTGTLLTLDGGRSC